MAVNSTSWRSRAAVARWRDGLLHITGCTPEEVAERLDLLFQFCVEHRVSPVGLIHKCRYSRDKMALRAFYLGAARRTPMNLAVQSFFVHNGINVFGELVCMPDTLERIVEDQGEQWRPRRA